MPLPLKVDCAALPESLIENELFGHVRGAFTGADSNTEGKVAAADGGTLFLDEIGELSVAVQGKLLRLIQDREFLQVGGTVVKRVSVRFICATHVDLEEAVASGRLRADLYHRLRVVELAVPPLRDRGHVDLDRLVDHFLYEYTRRHGRADLRLTSAARAAMHSYSWPGNVRELERCIESAVVLAPDEGIPANALPIRGASTPRRSHPVSSDAFVSAPDTLRRVELAYIRHVLALCQGNRSAAAKRLGIGRNTLARKLKIDPLGS